MFQAHDIYGEVVHASELLALSGDRPICYCPQCGGELVFKPGIQVTAHFAHKTGGEDCISQFESERHEEMKYRILTELRQYGYESPAMEIPRGDIQPDVWYHVHGGCGVGIECQASTMNPSDLCLKLSEYAGNCDSVLYIISAHLLPDVAYGEARLHEWLKLLHSIYMGRLYVFAEGGRIFPVHIYRRTRTIATGAVSWRQVPFGPKHLRTDAEPGKRLLDNEQYTSYFRRNDLSSEFTTARFHDPPCFWKKY